MRFKINKSIFLKALQKTQGIVEKKSTMAILSNLLIRALKNSIELTATDLEVGLKDLVEAEIYKEGGITVGARKLYEIVRELPEEDVIISTREDKEGWIEIRSGRAVFNIVGLSEDEFPTFPSYSEKEMSFIDTSDLKDMIEKTLFAVSTDEARYNINGVFFEKDIEEKTVRMVSTDGHRLAFITKPDQGIEELMEEGIIIPRKGVNELNKLISEGSNRVGLCIKENNIIFKTNNTILSVRLVDGDFPDYKQIIPKANDKSLGIDREEFLSVLKRISILSLERSKGIKLSLTRNKMVISTSNPDLGDAEEDISVDYDHEEIDMAFNARYLIEPLGIIETNNVLLEFKDPLSPAVIRPEDNNEYMYIVMPMRL